MNDITLQIRVNYILHSERNDHWLRRAKGSSYTKAFSQLFSNNCLFVQNFSFGNSENARARYNSSEPSLAFRRALAKTQASPRAFRLIKGKVLIDV